MRLNPALQKPNGPAPGKPNEFVWPVWKGGPAGETRIPRDCDGGV